MKRDHLACRARSWRCAAGRRARLQRAAQAESDPIGLMLSYTGSLAANSINSERALLMAIEAANAAGGVDGRPVRVLARDTRSDPRKVLAPAKELIDAGAAVLIGPDYTDLVTQLRRSSGPDLILPSFATASDVEWKPPSWFVMGAGLARVACELVNQYRADGSPETPSDRRPQRLQQLALLRALQTYGSSSRWSGDQTRPPPRRPWCPSPVWSAEAYLLAASPDTAPSLVYALTALGALEDPTRWFLSPTLAHARLSRVHPQGGAQGRARRLPPARSRARASSAGLQPALAGRAPRRRLPLLRRRRHRRARPRNAPWPRRATSPGIRPVPAHRGRHPPGGTPVHGTRSARAWSLLRRRGNRYFGLTGQLAFDNAGQTQTASTKWWTITDEGFVDVTRTSTCR